LAGSFNTESNAIEWDGGGSWPKIFPTNK
jgi:hypothetical protein